MPAIRRRYTPGFATRAAQTIQAAWRHRRNALPIVTPGGGNYIMRPRGRGRVSGYVRSLVNAATGVAAYAAGSSASRNVVNLSQTQRATGDGAGGSFSWWRFKRAPRGLPPPSTKVAKSSLVRNQAGRVTSGVGQQQVSILATHYDTTDLASQFVAVFGATPNKSSKIQIASVFSEAFLTNQHNVNAYFSLYDVIAKKDGNATVTNPQTAFTSGIADSAGGNATDYLIPGATFFSSPRFVEYFKVHKITECVLAPGATHVHRMYYAPNRTVSYQDALYDSSFTGGLTHYLMIISHGCPENSGATKTEVSLSGSDLDFVTKERYVYNVMYYPNNTSSIVQTIPTALTAGAIMNEDGAVIADASA